MNDNASITVVDALMGSGKTSWAIQEINENPDKSFVYCTPFLDEVTRIKNTCNRDFKEPQFKGRRKIDDFNLLLMNGEDIVLTHSTFANANKETEEYIQNADYTLILDETLDILIDFNNVALDKISKQDIKLLIREGFISYDEYGHVSWLKASYPNTKYFDVERLARNGNLFYLDGSMLVWQFPPQIFGLFKNVILLTYMFDGSFLKPYFEYHGISYKLAGIQKTNGRYELTKYKHDTEQQRRFKGLIDVLDNDKMNDYRASALSKSWFRRQNEKTLKKLQSNIYNYIKNIIKARSSDVLWTCPKDFKGKLKGRGYSIVRQLSPEERQLPDKEKKELQKTLECFLPCNARAINDYADRSVLAYVTNIYSNPFVKRFFENKNETDGTDIHIDQDRLALSCLLQWVWRSRIRNDKSIKIYVPSSRMRKLLLSWLDGLM